MKQLQNFSVTVQSAFVSWELNVMWIDTKHVSILMVIMLKNRLSHVVFVVSFSQQLIHAALRYLVWIFTFGMTIEYHNTLCYMDGLFSSYFYDLFLVHTCILKARVDKHG